MKKNKILGKIKKAETEEEEIKKIQNLANTFEKIPNSKFLMNKKNRDKVIQQEVDEHSDINFISDYKNNINFEENVNENNSQTVNTQNNFNNFTNAKSINEINLPSCPSNNFIDEGEDNFPFTKIQRNNFKSINFLQKYDSLFSHQKDLFKSRTNFNQIKGKLKKLILIYYNLFRNG